MTLLLRHVGDRIEKTVHLLGHELDAFLKEANLQHANNEENSS